MFVTVLFAVTTLVLFIVHPYLDLVVLKKVFGIALFLELFYLIGSYLSGWPFPTPEVIIQLIIVVALGVALGVIFSKIWPLPDRKGMERMARTILIVIPALGLGVGLQLILQGQSATQAIYLIFALSAWLGSGHFVKRRI
ncbi:hypothetical protein EDD68_10562 [Melghiribacillus thermohalophilus]|uniref:Uncharacterized protein n=1 Tax=Melghiribacillus thermohalophilus TaxID=1324956 RepID=A0A4R3N5V7_9BACI|nr:hypothetical protein [Melghiribacillus thermohalophilus]TCT24608.1 hypothetical protein EDD68_10562 [Melghiribacillus thermohalophilus]